MLGKTQSIEGTFRLILKHIFETSLSAVVALQTASEFGILDVGFNVLYSGLVLLLLCSLLNYLN